MTPTELRVEALRLSVATVGNTNKLLLAEQYFGFLKGPEVGGANKGKVK